MVDKSYLAITDDEHYYARQIDMDIMKCLVSKGHYCSSLGVLYPADVSDDWALALYSNDDHVIKAHCPITVNTISKNSITQLWPNHYLMDTIPTRSIEHRCPGCTDIKIVNLLLVLIIIPEECSIFTADFIITAINACTSKMPIALWGFQFDPFHNLSEPLFNFKFRFNFKLTNTTETKSNFILSRLLLITNVPIAGFMNTLE